MMWGGREWRGWDDELIYDVAKGRLMFRSPRLNGVFEGAGHQSEPSLVPHFSAPS